MNQLQIDTLKEMVMGRNYYAVPEMYYEFFDELVYLGFCDRQIISGKHIYKKLKIILLPLDKPPSDMV